MSHVNRKGLLGTKLGMTQLWDEQNRIVPVTAIQVDTNVVTQVKTPDSADGYAAIQLGQGPHRKATKPERGHFDRAGVTPRRHVVEIRTLDSSEYTLGQELTADTFAAGEVVDVTGTSRGRGFAGVVKRHGFSGLGAGHGVQRKHRSPGSIGGCATPGRVFKGLKMAGRLGGITVTTQNLTVHAVDSGSGVVLIKGSVPGPKGAVVLIRSAAKETPKEAGA